MVKKSSPKEKITAKKEEIYAAPISIRLSPELLKKIDEAAELEGLKRTPWIVKACENELAHGTVAGTPTDRETLAKLLLYDEGIMDIIYQKLAEKLGISDIREELGDFAVHGWDVKDQNLQLREFAAKMHSLISNPYHRDELFYDDWVNCILAWKDDWTYDEYLAKTPEELSNYEIFHMECRNPENSERGVGICIWSNEDHKNVKEYYKDFFADGECVHVLVGNINTSNPEYKVKNGFVKDVVKMIRYVCRDRNLGDNGDLTELKGTNYSVSQEGVYALDIPYQFRFSWVSDDRSSGKYYEEKDEKSDRSIRPQIEVRWHLTAYEEKKTGETPFTRQAVPENIRYGEYNDEFSGEKRRWVPVQFVPENDDGRKDRKGYPKTGKKEVKK